MLAPDPKGNGDRGPIRPVTLTKRADFLAAARAKRASRPAFTLQARRRGAHEHPDLVRIGFTCSKKVGNAVARNRAKRRLRALARDVFPNAGHAGWDYVLIGRPELTANRDFAKMRAELAQALASLHSPDKTS